MSIPLGKCNDIYFTNKCQCIRGTLNICCLLLLSYEGFSNDDSKNSCTDGLHYQCTRSLQIIFEFGVAKVLDSGNPKFKIGDLAWGMIGWEEYSIITATKSLFKI